MTGFEEELVERRRRDPNTAALCNEVLARCLVPPGEDFREALERVRGLTVAERDAALVRLRRLSLGDAVRSAATCPHCRSVTSVEFDLGQLPQPEGPRERVVVVREPAATLRLPTALDQEEMLAQPAETEAERRTALLARTLLRLGTQEGPFGSDSTRALPVGTRRALERALEEALPDFDLSMAVRCDRCLAEYAAPFDVAAFFLPR